MKNFTLIAFLICTLSFPLVNQAQTDIEVQSFESSVNDTWEFTSTPAPYNVGNDDVWDANSAFATLTPTDGTMLWGMRDLNNSNGGGSMDHVLQFENVNIDAYANVVVSFDYDVVSFDGPDYIQYQLTVDGIQQPVMDLPKNDSGSVSINIDNDYPGTNNLSLKIIANQDGGSDFAMVDNFRVTGDLVSTNDQTTTIFNPGQVISNTYNAHEMNSSDEAEIVLTFDITDAGSGDGLPTYVEKFRFTPGPNNTMSWSDNIQGLVLTNSQTYTPSSVLIEDDQIVLEFETPVDIQDGQTKSFVLSAYINETGITDGEQLQFKIDGTGHGFFANATGSNIEDPLAGGTITSNVLTVNVAGSELSFIEQPSLTEVFDPITPAVQVAITDENGNVDTNFNNFTNTIVLTTTGSFASSATTSVDAVNGVATFDNLIFDNNLSGVILEAANSQGYITGLYESDPFEITDASQIIANQDFDGNTPIWNYIKDVEFFDNGYGLDGYFGLIDKTNAGPLDNPKFSNQILVENDLNDLEADESNGTDDFVNLQFEQINLSGYNSVKLIFDYDIDGYNASNDIVKYQLFYGFTEEPQGEVILKQGSSANQDAEGTVEIDIPNNVTYVSFTLSIKNNGTDGYSGFDNIHLRGIPITPNSYVYDNGSWSPENPEDGVSGTVNDIIVMNGTATFNEDTYMNNLTVNSGANLIVKKVLYANGDITNDGNITFESTSETNTGMLGPLPSTSTIGGSGDVTVERFIPDGRAFRFLTSSVTTNNSIKENWQEGQNNTGTNYSTDNLNDNLGFGTHITGSTSGANGFDATISGNPSMFGYNNTSGSWTSVSNTDVNSLTAGTPYRIFIRGSRATNLSDNESPSISTRLRSTGQLLTGTVTTNVSNNAGAFNLVGNPYQCSVDMNSVMANSNNINTNYYYIYDPNIGENGGYVTVLLPSGSAAPTTTPTTGSTDANQYLQPGQAAFVRTFNTAANTQVVFEESSKEPMQTTTTFKPGQNVDESLFVYGQLFTQDGMASDAQANDTFWLRFSEGFNNEVNMADALKPFNIDENMGSMNNGEILSIENREMPFASEEIALFNNNYSSENYILKLNVSDFGDLTAYLKDNFTEELTPLQTGINEIAFNVDASNDSASDQRFSIVFQSNSLDVEDFENSSLVVYPNPVENGSVFIRMNNATNNKVSVRANNILGQEVYNSDRELNNKTLEITDAVSWNAGVYILTIQNDGKTFTKKVIIK